MRSSISSEICNATGGAPPDCAEGVRAFLEERTELHRPASGGSHRMSPPSDPRDSGTVLRRWVWVDDRLSSDSTHA